VYLILKFNTAQHCASAGPFLNHIKIVSKIDLINEISILKNRL